MHVWELVSRHLQGLNSSDVSTMHTAMCSLLREAHDQSQHHADRWLSDIEHYQDYPPIHGCNDERVQGWDDKLMASNAKVAALEEDVEYYQARLSCAEVETDEARKVLRELQDQLAQRVAW